MDNKKFNKPEHVNEEAWLRHLQQMATLDERAHENYTEYLSRARPNADYSKASLKAQYKALHDTDQDSSAS